VTRANRSVPPSPRGTWIAVLLVVTTLSMAGCAGPGFLAHVIKGPDQVDAIYPLPAGKTLVIVDDPDRAIGDPNLPAVIATNVGFHLDQSESLIDVVEVIPQDRLSGLAARMGNDYFATPIDRIGAQLGADQVVHVQIRSVSMRVAASYYRPTAVIEVKVVSARDGARLFPKAKIDTHSNTRPPGMLMTVQLRHQTADEGRRDTGTLLSRRLAERIGLEVAQLFYDHQKPDS
jgi:hypothetical protein